ncbi:MAG: protein translocase subunit SecD [Kiritimatiellae bacterium]|nr:protein translocase subunit SecD [Kiritimatiellia bacterium]
MKASIWKWLILIVVTAASLALVCPPKDKVQLGLDLQGGTSFTLEIQQDENLDGSLSDARDQAIEVIRNRIDALGIAEPSIYPDGDARIVVQIPGMKAEDRQRAADLIRKPAYLTFRVVAQKNNEWVKSLFDRNLVPSNYEIANLAQGDFWRRTAANPPDHAERDAIRDFAQKPGFDLLLEKETIDGRDYWRPWYVSRNVELDGSMLKSAGIGYGSQLNPSRSVDLSFDNAGRRAFAKITRDLAPGGPKNPSPDGRRHLAIVLDDTLYSAPYIREAIEGGNAQITGNFTLEEASTLATALRSGRLKARPEVIEERTVDPTLGEDSVASGKRAALVGVAGVLVLTTVYYHFAGLVASLALVLNLILLPLGMVLVAGFFGILGQAGLNASAATLPVLTLPGIAGIVLSIGMAVDANVLIFERIREEMKLGKRFGAALDAGYDKAFRTILDANVTTLLTAVILFWLGSGPVKGFAITLSAGIIVSMYTAIWVTRMVFDFLESRGLLSNLGMMSLVPETKIDFLGKRKIAAVLSVVVILASLGYMYSRGRANFGVDFTGGQQLTFSFEQKADVDAIRAAFAANPDAAVDSIQYQRAGVTGDDLAPEVLALKVAAAAEGETDPAEAAISTLAEAFPESQFTLKEKTSVGARVGSELQRKALWALFWSLVLMLVYIAIRFDFSFGVGAIVALAHNILVTLGLYAVCGRTLTMTSIAAFLTVLGYSINDTIVVFDRIRETKKLRNRLDAAVCNESVNSMLGRTILTSVTTLVSLVALMIFGSGEIFDFAVALAIGVCVGTYASVFIATPVMLAVRPRFNSETAPAPAPKKARK